MKDLYQVYLQVNNLKWYRIEVDRILVPKHVLRILFKTCFGFMEECLESRKNAYKGFQPVYAVTIFAFWEFFFDLLFCRLFRTDLSRERPQLEVAHL